MMRMCGVAMLPKRRELSGGSRRFGEAGNIARNLIDFEVCLVADLAFVPGGDLEGMRDQHALEPCPVDAVDGERGAVEGDGSLGRNEFGQRRRRLEDETRGLAEVLAPDDGRQPVDMAADHVAAKLVADLERS